MTLPHAVTDYISRKQAVKAHAPSEWSVHNIQCWENKVSHKIKKATKTIKMALSTQLTKTQSGKQFDTKSKQTTLTYLPKNTNLAVLVW